MKCGGFQGDLDSVQVGVLLGGIPVGALGEIATGAGPPLHGIGMAVSSTFGIPFLKTGAAVGARVALFDEPGEGLGSVFREPDVIPA